MEGKNILAWHTKFELCIGKTPAKNLVHIRPGPSATARDTFTPTECFQLFISQDIRQKINTHTNEEIFQQRALYRKSNEQSLNILEDH